MKEIIETGLECGSEYFLIESDGHLPSLFGLGGTGDTQFLRGYSLGPPWVYSQRGINQTPFDAAKDRELMDQLADAIRRRLE